MNVSDLIETQRELTEARIEAEDNARKLAEASAESRSGLLLKYQWSQVVAEGVETEAHVKMVRELGCQYMQGFALAEPLPREALLDMFGPDKQQRFAS